MSDESSGPSGSTEHMHGPALAGRGRSDPKQPPVRPNLTLYWFLYIGCWIAYALLLSIGSSQWDAILFSVGPLNFSRGFTIMLPGLIHFALSLKKVGTEEAAGKYFYGVPLFRALPGLNYVPFGIMNLERYPGDPQEIFLPAEPDQVFWGDEKEALPAGMVRPIWIPTRSPREDEKDPADAQMVVGIVGYAFWRVSDVFTFHARVTSIREGNSQLRSIWVRVASEDIVQYTAGGAIKNQQSINENLDDNIRIHTSDWGIQVTSAGITKINISHELGRAMRDRTKAPFEAETRVIAAEAEATEIERLGRAKGIALEAETAGPLKGRAAGLQAIADAVKSDEGKLALASETAIGIAKETEVIMAGAESGMRDLMTAAAAVKKGLGAGGSDAKGS